MPVPLTLHSMQQQGRLYLLDLMSEHSTPTRAADGQAPAPAPLRVDDLVLLTAEPPPPLHGRDGSPPALHMLALVHRVWCSERDLLCAASHLFHKHGALPRVAVLAMLCQERVLFPATTPTTPTTSSSVCVQSDEEEGPRGRRGARRLRCYANVEGGESAGAAGQGGRLRRALMALLPGSTWCVGVKGMAAEELTHSFPFDNVLPSCLC